MDRRYGPLSVARYLSAANPSSYGGRGLVQRYSRPKSNMNEVEGFLSAVDTYTLHRQPKPPKKNPLFVHRLRELIQVDLTDRQHEAAANDDYRYWLVVQDTFSRKIWLKLLKRKNSKLVATEFRKMLLNINLNGVPERCLNDRGTEFMSFDFRRVLRDYDIAQSLPLFHAPHVERVQATLQNYVSRYQTEHATDRYVHVMDKIVKLYNSKFHRIIKMSPDQAERGHNHDRVRLHLSEYYQKGRESRKKPKYKVGQWVRVINVRGTFARSYNQTFGQYMYQIHRVDTNLPRPLYSLTSSSGEKMADRYYEEELQLIGGQDGNVFKVNAIIGRRRNPQTGVREVLVNWVGFEEGAGTWEPASSMVSAPNHGGSS